jgi:hypothetical protein
VYFPVRAAFLLLVVVFIRNYYSQPNLTSFTKVRLLEGTPANNAATNSPHAVLSPHASSRVGHRIQDIEYRT